MQTVAEFLTAQKESDAPFVVSSDRSITYREVNATAGDLARFLVAHGITEQNIAIFAGNSAEYVVCYFAGIFANCTNIPVNTKLEDNEIKHELIYCDCKWILCHSDHLHRLVSISDSSGIGIVAVDPAMRFWIEKPATRAVERANSSDVAVMLHTSGTTGNYKKVMLTHRNLYANTLSAIQSLSLSKSDTVLVALPLFFGYAHTAQFLVHTRLGSKIVLYDAPLFSPKRFCELVETHRVSCFTAVPSMLMMLHIYPYLEHHDLTSLRLVCFGGGGVSLDMLRSLMKRLPDTGFVQTYGQTECSPRVTALLPADSTRKIGSVGRPIPGVRVDIVSEDGTSVADGCVGEIRVQGENTCPGYYKNPEETAKIIRDGWLYTGDLAKRDEEGYIYLVGRKKNMVISGGINIYPEDVESVLRLHPSVEDVIVKGKPDDFMGEVPVAEVLCKSGCTLTLGDLHVFLRGKLATYKWPKEITLVSQLPKTATGKTKRT